MINILFVLNDKSVDYWVYNFIKNAQKQTNTLIKYVIISTKQDGTPLFLNVIKLASKKKYPYKLDAFKKMAILDLNIPIEKDKQLKDALIFNFTGQDIARQFNFQNNKIIEFRYGKECGLDYKYFGPLEIQSKLNSIYSSLYLSQNQNVSLIQETVSSLNSLAFMRSLNEHYFKLSIILERFLHNFIQGELVLTKVDILEYKINKVNYFKLCSVLVKKSRTAILRTIYPKTKKKWKLLFSDTSKNDFSKYITLHPPTNYFWADPFVWSNDNNYKLFIEEKKNGTKAGYISVIDFKINEELRAKKIIEENYHLSYPFFFEFKDNYYIIPESASNKTINLYKCIEYPYKWTFVKFLMENVKAVDSTLFEYNNKWWLFTNMQSIDGMSIQDELFLFHSDSPLSTNWVPHRMNPIVSDVRKSRPAGKIFIEDGKIYRPSQNSAERYGKSIKINEILILSENEYYEQEVNEIRPWSKDIEAIHTINTMNNFTIIDAFK